VGPRKKRKKFVPLVVGGEKRLYLFFLYSVAASPQQLSFREGAGRGGRQKKQKKPPPPSHMFQCFAQPFTGLVRTGIAACAECIRITRKIAERWGFFFFCINQGARAMGGGTKRAPREFFNWRNHGGRGVRHGPGDPKMGWGKNRLCGEGGKGAGGCRLFF